MGDLKESNCPPSASASLDGDDHRERQGYAPWEIRAGQIISVTCVTGPPVRGDPLMRGLLDNLEYEYMCAVGFNGPVSVHEMHSCDQSLRVLRPFKFRLCGQLGVEFVKFVVGDERRPSSNHAYAWPGRLSAQQQYRNFIVSNLKHKQTSAVLL